MRIQRQLAAALPAAFLLAGVGFAQLVPFPRTWSRTYGGSNSEQGLHDLRRLPGGRLAVAGHSSSFGGPFPSNWLLNVGLENGDVLFESVSSTVQGGFVDGASLSADGGALFLGRHVIDPFTKHDAWLIRVNAGGNVVWTQEFTRPGAGRHFLFDAAELADGSWIAVGATSIFDFPPQHAWIVRLSAAGVPLWHFEYGGGLAESARSVTPTSDGGFAVAGVTNSSGAGSDDAWVMKIDAFGAIQWQKTFGGLDVDQAEEIIELADGSFAVVGATMSLTPSGRAPWVMRLSSAGALLWHQAVESGVWGDLSGAALASDGNLFVVGRVFEPGSSSNELWSAKLAVADGTILWQRAYQGDLSGFGTVVLPLAEQSLVVAGFWDRGFPTESIWLQRTDRRGGITDCDLVRTTAFATVSPPISVQDTTFVRVWGGARVQDVQAQVRPSQALVIDRCD